MASELTITSLYHDRETGAFVLLRTVRPAYANYSQGQDDQAYEIEQTRRKSLLSYAAATLGTHKMEAFELIGELQDLPIGEILMTALGGLAVELFYLHTEYGYPWIILGTARNETDFLQELSEDEDLLRLKPIGKPLLIEAKCFAESDAAFPGRT